MYTITHFGLDLVLDQHDRLRHEAAQAREVRQAVRPARVVPVRFALSLVQSWRSPMRWAWGG